MPRRRHSAAGELNRSLDIALQHGDLPMSLAAANDLPVVGLDRAARLLALMAREHSPLYARAAARWVARFAIERENVTPTELADVAEAISALQWGDPEATEVLLAAVRGRPV